MKRNKYINKFFKKYHNYGFTLIEIMLGIMIFSFVIVIGFQALGSVGIGKVRLMSKVSTDKQIYYFSEKLFEEIKKGGKIDYEEYFNRKVYSTSFLSGHYEDDSGFGNFGNNGTPGTTTYGPGFYYCRSTDSINMSSLTSNPTLGCFSGTDLNSAGDNVNGKTQRYLQYALQYIDYNSNLDTDGGDEDSDGNIRGDDDDEYLGEGPEVFTGGTDVKELYLISGDKTKRTIFRWNVKNDPDNPVATCDYSNPKSPTGSGCLGTIEYLKLEGRDWGMDHIFSTSDTGQFDGVIDTWIISRDFLGLANNVVAGSVNMDNYWIPLFPDTINVTDFKVFPYPNKDLDLSWKDYSPEVNIAPYVRIQLSILPSWKSRKKIKGNPQEVKFSTTIALTDIFSR